MTNINTYKHLSVDLIEEQIDKNIEYLENEINKMEKRERFSNMSSHDAYLFGRKITKLESLKDLKSDLYGLDLMKECKRIEESKWKIVIDVMDLVLIDMEHSTVLNV